MFDDPYSYAIGGPLPSHDDYPPLAPVTKRVDFPSLQKTIIEEYEWEQTPREHDLRGKPIVGVCRLKVTFVDARTGEVVDIHYRDFLTGKLLSLVKKDFKKYGRKTLNMAREACDGFPKTATVSLNKKKDPAVDEQSYFMTLTDYIEVKKTSTARLPWCCELHGTSDRQHPFVGGSIYYRTNGTVGRTEIGADRYTQSFQVRTTTFFDDDEPILDKITHYDRGRKVDEIVTNRKVARKKAQEERKKRKLKAAGKDPDKIEAEKKAKALKAQQVKEERARITKFIIENHKSMTNAEIGEALGLTAKAVERRIYKLRHKGELV